MTPSNPNLKPTWRGKLDPYRTRSAKYRNGKKLTLYQQQLSRCRNIVPCDCTNLTSGSTT
jgi:hypothetical protein